MPIDPNRYPDHWQQLSQAAKERDGWRCRHCGARHGDILPSDDPYAGMPPIWPELAPPRPEAKTVVITTAHLDRDELNHEVSLDRLISLCAACHLQYDRNDNQQRRRYGKHFRDNQLSLL